MEQLQLSNGLEQYFNLGLFLNYQISSSEQANPEMWMLPNFIVYMELKLQTLTPSFYNLFICNWGHFSIIRHGQFTWTQAHTSVHISFPSDPLPWAIMSLYLQHPYVTEMVHMSIICPLGSTRYYSVEPRQFI